MEGQPSDETTNTVVITPSRPIGKVTGIDWRSPSLGNMFGLFSRISQTTNDSNRVNEIDI